MEWIMSGLLGLGLAAACGFRVFVPFLVMSLAAKSGHLDLAGSFEWIGSDVALATFGAAAAVEIGAYYVPWLDHALDLIATPTAVVAGVIAVAATSMDGASPLMTWSLAAIGGGGAAAVVQSGTVIARGFSGLMTAGFGNPVVNTVESAGSVLVAAAAVFVPVLALLFVATFLILGARGVGSRMALANQTGTRRPPDPERRST